MVAEEQLRSMLGKFLLNISSATKPNECVIIWNFMCFIIWVLLIPIKISGSGTKISGQDFQKKILFR